MGKVHWGSVACALLLATGVECSGNTVQEGVEINGHTDAGVVVDGQGLGAPAGSGPGVLSVSIPAGASGVIPLSLSLIDHQADRVQIAASVSLDQGATWKTAHVRVPGSNPPGDGTTPVQLPADGVGVTSIVTWDSLSDIGFHTPRSVLLRLTPSDVAGAGTPAQFATPEIDNLRAAARRVDHYLINY